MEPLILDAPALRLLASLLPYPLAAQFAALAEAATAHDREHPGNPCVWRLHHPGAEPQPAVEPSPILRIETTRGAVSVDVRTIVGAAWTDGGTVYLAAPDHRALDFPGADQAALALDRIHAARVQHDDQHAEDRRTERMAEAVARGVADELRAVLPGLGVRLVAAVEQRVPAPRPALFSTRQEIIAAGLRSDLSAADAVRHLAAVRDRQQSLLARVLGWREMRDDDWRALLLEIDAVLGPAEAYDDQHAEDRRTERMAEAIARGVAEELRAVLPGLGARLVAAVEQRVPAPRPAPLVPLDTISLERLDWGGIRANAEGARALGHALTVVRFLADDYTRIARMPGPRSVEVNQVLDALAVVDKEIGYAIDREREERERAR